MAEVQLATLAAEAREAIDSQDLARAADACRRALMRFPRWVEGYWLLGHILVESGYVAQARSCFEAVASAMPDDPRAYQGLADVAEQQHDLPTAVAGLIRALEVGETSPSVLEELRRLQEQAGYVVDNPFTTARVAHARLIAGQYEEADVAAERALQQAPERLDLLVVQAVARLFGGDRRGSEAVCQRLLDISPDCLKALAILRYLRPGQEAASIAADLDALDPEGQTLVWLRGQMTTLGYEADDLPSAPNLVRWQEEGNGPAETGRDQRPLDRLIPELEEVWPQWLKQAATDTPEARSAEATMQPPPPAEVAAQAPATPSFLGDVDALAREFEEAMRPATPAAQPSGAEAVEDRIGEPAVIVGAPLAPSLGGQVPLSQPEAEDEQTGAAVAITEDAEPIAHAEVEPEAATADDEFGQWRATEQTIAAQIEHAAAAVSEPAPAPAGQWDADWAPVAPAEAAAPPAVAETAVAEAGVGAGAPIQAEQEQTVEAVAVVIEPAEAAPAGPSVGADDQELTRDAAAAAAAAGDYWSAIDRYGAVLAKLRSVAGGRE